MNRIDKKFMELKKRKGTAFIPFITAGYPDLAATEALVPALERSGADIIELGVPFSEPIADGPIIQEASHHALEQGATLRKILGLVGRLRRRSQVPLCLMTYYNPVFCYGGAKFIRDALKAGLDGLIIPDLPPEEDSGFFRASTRAGLRRICFLAPTSTPQRIRAIGRIAQGFIYYVSLTGVTGPRAGLAPDLGSQLRRIRAATDLPVCVGFGVSTPRQVRDIAKIADGVIVGSSIIKKIREHSGRKDMPQRVGAFLRYLKGA